MKKSLFITLMMLANMTAALASRDTIVMRPDHYYFEEWYDTSSAVMSYQPPYPCPVCLYSMEIGSQDLIAYSQHTNSRLKVKGLAVMAEDYVNHPHRNGPRPEDYLYLYQFDASAPDSMVVLDSLRYDDVTPRTIAVPLCTNSRVEYNDVYEVYFKEPIYVDSIFFIGSSGHCQGYNETVSWMPLLFRPIYTYPVSPDNIKKYYCPELGWRRQNGTVNYYSWGPFFAIVDNHNLDVIADTAERGSVSGSGRFADSSFNPISASPNYGYRFVEWNDGNRDNPRVVCLTQDTLFTAIFAEADFYILSTESNNPKWGSVEGNGLFPEQQPITISAIPNAGHIFLSWNDGNTDNPRTVYLSQDTLFTAIFRPLEQFDARTQVNSSSLGSVTGGGTYTEFDTVTLHAVAQPWAHFVRWSDGDTNALRKFAITQDTLFTAIFEKGILIRINVGIDDADASHAFTITPNPARDIVTVTLADGCDRAHATLVLRDALGKELRRITPSADKTAIPLQGLPAGTYLLTLSTPQGSSTQKLVIE